MLTLDPLTTVEREGDRDIQIDEQHVFRARNAALRDAWFVALRHFLGIHVPSAAPRKQDGKTAAAAGNDDDAANTDHADTFLSAAQLRAKYNIGPVVVVRRGGEGKGGREGGDESAEYSEAVFPLGPTTREVGPATCRESLEERLVTRLLRPHIDQPPAATQLQRPRLLRLVLDKWTRRIVQSVVPRTRLITLGVVLVDLETTDWSSSMDSTENATDLASVFYIAPTCDSVRDLCFAVERLPLPGGAVHLHFSSPPPQDLLSLLKEHRLLRARISTLDVDFHLDVVMPEPSLVLLGLPAVPALPVINPTTTLLETAKTAGDATTCTSDSIPMMAARLSSLCVALGEYPLIRFSDRGGSGCLPRSMAEALQAKVNDEYARSLAYEYNTDTRATVLIVDRADDLAAPLMTEYVDRKRAGVRGE